MRRRRTHESTKRPKHILAPSSLWQYLNSFANSINMSLTSCSARITVPARNDLKNPTKSASWYASWLELVLQAMQQYLLCAYFHGQPCYYCSTADSKFFFCHGKGDSWMRERDTHTHTQWYRSRQSVQLWQCGETSWHCDLSGESPKQAVLPHYKCRSRTEMCRITSMDICPTTTPIISPAERFSIKKIKSPLFSCPKEIRLSLEEVPLLLFVVIIVWQHLTTNSRSLSSLNQQKQQIFERAWYHSKLSMLLLLSVQKPCQNPHWNLATKPQTADIKQKQLCKQNSSSCLQRKIFKLSAMMLLYKKSWENWEDWKGRLGEKNSILESLMRPAMPECWSVGEPWLLVGDPNYTDLGRQIVCELPCWLCEFTNLLCSCFLHTILQTLLSFWQDQQPCKFLDSHTKTHTDTHTRKSQEKGFCLSVIISTRLSIKPSCVVMVTLRKKKRKMGTGAMQMGNWSNPEQRERMRFSAAVLDSQNNSHGG